MCHESISLNVTFSIVVSVVFIHINASDILSGFLIVRSTKLWLLDELELLSPKGLPNVMTYSLRKFSQVHYWKFSYVGTLISAYSLCSYYHNKLVFTVKITVNTSKLVFDYM